ncbi:MAG: Ig-like domain-containing protein, partial [Gammaproteobacteria bacterium]
IEILPFEHATMSVVYSASDDDAEILIRATGVDPIGQVGIVGPDGTVRLKAKFRDGDRLGQADVQFDTPEPSLEDLMQAYPEGEYRFRGRTAAGEKLAGVAELSYELLPAPEIRFPLDGATDVPTKDLEVRSVPVAPERILLQVEDEKEKISLSIDLPGDAVRFTLPNDWLQPGVLYTLDIKLIAENGNQTVRDVRFTTAD